MDKLNFRQRAKELRQGGRFYCLNKVDTKIAPLLKLKLLTIQSNMPENTMMTSLI